MDPSTEGDCRSLIDFCKAIKKHRAMAAAAVSNNHDKHSPAAHRSASVSSRRGGGKSLNPLSHPFCSHSPFAAIDAVILLLVLAATAVLALPYLRLLAHHASRLLPAAVDLIGDAVYRSPVAYGLGFVLALAAGLAVRELLCYRCRRCENPGCKGLKKAGEFDIQIESEECVRSFQFARVEELFGAMPMMPLQVGRDRDELEAELKKMAPANGRTVLFFRAPCGCPAGRMEVWGGKKNRKGKR